jgi:hypothetical protein
MIGLIASVVLQYDWSPKPVPASLAIACSAYVGIPYASDNFTDEQFLSFKNCVLNRSYD